MLNENATVHRTAYDSGKRATQRFEQTRADVAALINASSRDEIVFTKGATESLNLIAAGLDPKQMLEGNTILICGSEHHANLLPWQRFAQQHAMQITIMPMDDDGCIKLNETVALIDGNTAIVAIAHIANALGNYNPIDAIIDKAKRHRALTVIDGTQAIAHVPVDVVSLGCDFYVFSGHKMYGPTGVGVLYGQYERLCQLAAYQVGGEMVKTADYSSSAYQLPPLKFEAGTPNILGVIGLQPAVQFIRSNIDSIGQHEARLASHLYDALDSIQGLRMWGEFGTGKSQLPIASFSLDGHHPHDIALLLDHSGIAVRSGHHCTMPLMQHLGVEGTVRISLGAYNSIDDIEHIVHALRNVVAETESQEDNSQGHLSDAKPIASAIKNARGWDGVNRELMLAGKALTSFPAEYQIEQNQVMGCEASVWLVADNKADNQRLLSGYSPSKIVRGLLAVILEQANSLSLAQQKAFDYRAYLDEIGLARYLSESRLDGIRAVINKIQSD